MESPITVIGFGIGGPSISGVLLQALHAINMNSLSSLFVTYFVTLNLTQTAPS